MTTPGSDTSFSKMFFVAGSAVVRYKSPFKGFLKTNYNLKVEAVWRLVLRCEQDVLDVVSKQRWRRQVFQLGCESYHVEEKGFLEMVLYICK